MRPWEPPKNAPRAAQGTAAACARGELRLTSGSDLGLETQMQRVTRRDALALFSAGALGGCMTTGSVSDANARFDAIAARALDGMARLSPVAATQLGDHRFDAELDDVGASGRRASAAWYNGLRAELVRIDAR